MGILSKLFGKGRSDSSGPKEPPPEEKPIRVFDAYGREVFVSRDDWRKNILPGNLEKHWDDADSLYPLIVQSLRDEFVSDVALAARRLFQIDHDTVRGATVLGIVEMELGRLDVAESVLKQALTGSKEDGILLTNLAKVISKRGDQEESERTLWRGLQADPNQDNGLSWWIAIHRDREGAKGEADALERAAALPGSFRASLWLAAAALQRGDLRRALELYEVPLALDEVPSDVLMQVSGDLGKAGKLTELLALVTPRFQIGSHGIAVGNNLLKAYVELDRTTEARALLERLYAAQRPDWRETLAYWERTIDDKTRGFGPVNEPVPAIAIVQLIGPSWCREKEGFATLLAPKAAAAPRVAVMMPSCNPSKPSGVSVSQRTNAEGALSRAIALALAESVHLDTSAVGIALVPILAPPSGGGFVLAGAPASIDALRNAAGQSVAAIASLHLNAETDPWQLSMTVHATNTTSPDTNRQIEVPIDPAKPEGALASLRAVLKSAALELSGATATLRPEWARPPHGDELASWLAGTEQCLAVVCADPSHGGAAISLYGERSIVDGILSAAVARPESVPWRMLLVTVLNRLVEARPEIAGEYFDRAERLMREHAVGGDIGSAIAHVLSALRERQPKHS